MSAGAILGYVFGIMGPIAMLAACVFEFLAMRMSKNPRCDKKRLEKRRRYADIGLVAAWLLLAASYVCFQSFAPDREALSAGFEGWMTGCLLALLVLDIMYLFLRRSRPRQAGKKKFFWEI